MCESICSLAERTWYANNSDGYYGLEVYFFRPALFTSPVLERVYIVSVKNEEGDVVDKFVMKNIEGVWQLNPKRWEYVHLEKEMHDCLHQLDLDLLYANRI